MVALRGFLARAIALGVVCVSSAQAQDSGNLAQEAQNPIANLISVPFLPAPVLRQLQPEARLVPHLGADHHRRLERARRRPMDAAARRRRGRVFNIGSQPVNMSLSAYDNVITPEQGPDWQLRFQVQLLFPAGG
jgi:hypothetical protein